MLVQVQIRQLRKIMQSHILLGFFRLQTLQEKKIYCAYYIAFKFFTSQSLWQMFTSFILYCLRNGLHNTGIVVLLQSVKKNTMNFLLNARVIVVKHPYHIKGSNTSCQILKTNTFNIKIVNIISKQLNPISLILNSLIQ